MNTRTMKPGATAAITLAALAGILSAAAVTSGSVRHADRAAPRAAEQRLKLTASDAAAFDWFGSSVAVSGELVVVGVRYDDDDGGSSGSAYIFNSSTGDELFKLTASDAVMGDLFGRSVAVSGARVVVGVFSDDDNGSSSGSAYVFDSGTGAELLKLTASDAAAGDYFGSSVALSGVLAVVGADGNSDGGDFSGSAYVFDISTDEELFKLTATDAAAHDRFGFAVAVSGDRAVVGADGNDDGGSGSGSAYVFDLTTGNQLFKLTALDAAPDDRFGVSVAVSGDLAVIGAYRADHTGGLDSGSAYVFDITTGNQLFKLTASDAEAGDEFGRAVAVSGGRIVVGASHHFSSGLDSGSAYVFDISTGEELFKLNANDAAAGDRFGFSVAASGDRAVIGAHYDSDGGSASGSAYVFDLAVCPADLNGDGVVDTADLGILIGNFGASTTNHGDGDINGDGIVDTADLGILIAGFGEVCG